MAGKITPAGIVVRQGDCFDILFNFSSQCGESANIEGCSLKMAVKKPGSDKFIFMAEAQIVDAQKGKAIIHLTPAQTQAAVGDYICDIQMVMADGCVHTIYPQDVNKVATFRITEQVTR